MLGLKQTATLVVLMGFSLGNAHGADLLGDAQLSYKDGPGNYWVVTIGGYAGGDPVFPGSKYESFNFRPIIEIRRAGEPERLYLPTDAISVALYRSGNFSAGIAGDYLNNRSHNDDGAQGLHGINYTVELGGFAEYYAAPFLRTRVEVLQGLNASKGLLANLSADYIYKPSPAWQFTAGPRLQFANTQYESTFFSVSGADSVTSGLAPYHASGGLNSAGIDFTARYNVSDRLSLRAFADWERLVGDGGSSPIVKLRGSEDQFEFGVGAAYTFNYAR